MRVFFFFFLFSPSLSVHPSIHPSIHLSIHPSLHPSSVGEFYADDSRRHHPAPPPVCLATRLFVSNGGVKEGGGRGLTKQRKKKKNGVILCIYCGRAGSTNTPPLLSSPLLFSFPQAEGDREITVKGGLFRPLHLTYETGGRASPPPTVFRRVSPFRTAYVSRYVCRVGVYLCSHRCNATATVCALSPVRV